MRIHILLYCKMTSVLRWCIAWVFVVFLRICTIVDDLYGVLFHFLQFVHIGYFDVVGGVWCCSGTTLGFASCEWGRNCQHGSPRKSWWSGRWGKLIFINFACIESIWFLKSKMLSNKPVVYGDISGWRIVTDDAVFGSVQSLLWPHWILWKIAGDVRIIEVWVMWRFFLREKFILYFVDV